VITAIAPCPGWLTEEDDDHYASEFQRTGYAGGLNWYRTSKLNWELMAAWHNTPLTLSVNSDVRWLAATVPWRGQGTR
jgi:hypothetical protein